MRCRTSPSIGWGGSSWREGVLRAEFCLWRLELGAESRPKGSETDDTLERRDEDYRLANIAWTAATDRSCLSSLPAPFLLARSCIVSRLMDALTGRNPKEELACTVAITDCKYSARKGPRYPCAYRHADPKPKSSSSDTAAHKDPLMAASSASATLAKSRLRKARILPRSAIADCEPDYAARPSSRTNSLNDCPHEFPIDLFRWIALVYGGRCPDVGSTAARWRIVNGNLPGVPSSGCFNASLGSNDGAY